VLDVRMIDLPSRIPWVVRKTERWWAGNLRILRVNQPPSSLLKPEVLLNRTNMFRVYKQVGQIGAMLCRSYGIDASRKQPRIGFGP
jgi:hypothetical protein